MLKKSLLALALSSLLAAPAYADLKINGFASIKAGTTLAGDETLYGYEDKLDFKNESLFAVQVQSDLGDKLSITAQLLGRGAEDFKAEFEWAFLSYQLTDNMKINAGRLRTPFYRYSDFKDVGYTYDWARVPNAVYNLDFDNIEGISFYRTATIAGFDSTLQIIYGSYDGSSTVMGLEVEAEIKNVAGVTWELSRDYFSARLAYLSGKTSLNNPAIDSLTTSLNALGLTSLREAIDVYEEKSSFIGLALTYDHNNVVLVGEITQAEVKDSVVPKQHGYYVSAGYRFGSVTPFISYEKRDNDAKRELYGLLPAGVPPAIVAPVQYVVELFELKREAWNLGLRYDFHPSAAFKVQYTRSEDKQFSTDANLLTFGVDLVF